MAKGGLAAALCLAAAPAPPAGEVADADVLAISQKHCLSCHARNPGHPSFAEAPGGVVLETIADLRRFSRAVLEQTITARAMSMGNESGMTEEERAKLGAWIRTLK